VSDDGTVPDDEVYRELRPLLFAIAYRMLSGVADAEDVVQEAFLRYRSATAAGERVASPRAYLSTVTTRLCIDHLRSARNRHEQSVGTWLPEPVLTGADPAEHAELADSLSMAFLLLLERLSPVERAVFLLHDVFGYAFDEVAGIVGKSVDNCRQLALRARRHVEAGRPRFEADRQRRDELAARFLAAMGDGDVGALVSLLAEDVVVQGDSGGGRPAWGREITGRDRVARLLAGMSRQIREAGGTLRASEVNGQPGALCLAPDGRLVSVFAFDLADGVVTAVRSVINPHKLGHLGELADPRELVRASNRRPGR
jgi:RNA polymerase sigma-70 factor (ECF subfamily)